MISGNNFSPLQLARNPLPFFAPMLNWIMTFLLLALICAVLGFGLVGGAAAAIARGLFLFFLTVFAVSFFASHRKI